MTDRWATSTRRSRLPKDWKALRRQAQARAGGRCQDVTDDGARCTRLGTDCDHIDDPDDHSLSNLQWLCHPHHEVKTKRQAAQARHRHRRNRPTKPHIGLRPTATPTDTEP